MGRAVTAIQHASKLLNDIKVDSKWFASYKDDVGRFFKDTIEVEAAHVKEIAETYERNRLRISSHNQSNKRE